MIIREPYALVISNPGIPGEKSLNSKQISPRILVEMTAIVSLSSSHYAQKIWVGSRNDTIN